MRQSPIPTPIFTYPSRSRICIRGRNFSDRFFCWGSSSWDCFWPRDLLHSGIVWVEEAYPTAAAIQILDGKALYRDVWFDKPPLSASFICGGTPASE